VFARLANGNVAPERVIEGQGTRLSRTMHGIAYDDVHDEIILPVALSGAILVFRGDAQGEAAPVRVIQGGRTGLIRPHTIAVDTVNGEIIAADPSSRALLVFARDAAGDAAPIRIISGARTLLHDIVGVAVDPIRNVIVASSRSGRGATGIMVFDRLASGDVPPRAYIGGPNSRLAHFRQLAIDPGTGNIFLAQQRTRPKRMDAYVAGSLARPREEYREPDGSDESDFGRLTQTGFIAVYAADDTGDIPPRAIIKGPGIRHAGAGGVALNPRTGEVIAVGGNGISTYLLPEFFQLLKKPGTSEPATEGRPQ
jgi:hypothetical protein